MIPPPSRTADRAEQECVWRRQRAPTCGSNDGFSVVEILIVSSLMLLVMAAVFPLLFQGQALFDTQADATAIRQEVRIPIKGMTRDLRMTGYGLANVGQAIQVATDSLLRVAADLDNGSTDGPCSNEAGDAGVERITYKRAGGDLTREVHCWSGTAWLPGPGEQLVLSNVRSDAPLFRYFDVNANELIATGTGLIAAQRAYVVEIWIRIDVQDTDKQVLIGTDPHPRSAIDTRVLIRNRALVGS